MVFLHQREDKGTDQDQYYATIRKWDNDDKESINTIVCEMSLGYNVTSGGEDFNLEFHKHIN